MNRPFLYVVGSIGGPQKIGFSTDPSDTLRRLQRGHPRLLTLVAILPVDERADARRIESAAHALLAPRRLAGEWFEVEPRAAVAALRRAQREVAERRGRRIVEMPNLPAVQEDLAGRAAQFARSARSPATERAYRFDWRDFEAWCDDHRLSTLPATPQTVGLYFTALSSSRKASTIQRRLAAISNAHRLSGHRLDTRHPAIAEVLAGIRRKLGTKPASKRALMVSDLRAMLRRTPDTLAGARDRALLLIGFAGAFRRSELVGLDVEDLAIDQRGVAITIRRSKGDQEGAGQVVGIPRSKKATCPVAALEAWLQKSGINTGAVFRSVHRDGQLGARLCGDVIARIVKAVAARAGLDHRLYGAHSLRSGFATSAAEGGADLAAIMGQTRHKSVAVARGYVQAGTLFANRASRAIGL